MVGPAVIVQNMDSRLRGSDGEFARNGIIGNHGGLINFLGGPKLRAAVESWRAWLSSRSGLASRPA